MLKNLHITLALLSLSGFILRFGWMLRSPQQLGRPVVRIVPHVVDTLLFVSGLGLVVIGHWYPWQQPWLAAKLGALLLYIVFGSIALKRGRSRGVRAAAGLGAVAVFAYIVAVALTRSPLP